MSYRDGFVARRSGLRGRSWSGTSCSTASSSSRAANTWGGARRGGTRPARRTRTWTTGCARRCARVVDRHGRGRHRFSSSGSPPFDGPWRVRLKPITRAPPMRVAPHPLIYDWNHDQAPRTAAAAPVAMLNDETLRDGLQSPSVRTPTIDERIAILHHMDALGIDTADIGLPGAGPRVAKDVERSRARSSTAASRIRPNCAARTRHRRHRADCRDQPADGHRDRMRRVHRVELDPPVRGRVDARLPAAMHGGRADVRRRRKACR